MLNLSPSLPFEVIDIVARFLIGDNAHASCANLNRTSHAVRDATLQTLWTHVYWTKYHDSKKYKRDEVEAKWSIFKASRGSRYMIKPYLPVSPTDDRKRSIMSCSINANLKATVSVDVSNRGKQVQVHLFGEYGYSQADMGSIRQALGLVQRLPAFEHIAGIQIAVLATPANLPDASLGGSCPLSRSNVANGPDTTGNAKANDSIQGSADDSGVDWLQHAGFSVDDSAHLDADKRIVVWHHVLDFVRPYARQRIISGGKTSQYDHPEIWMKDLRSRDILPNASAYAYVCRRDPISATFLIFWTGPDEDEDEDDHLSYGAAGMQQLVSSAHLVKDGYILAAETIPADLLGVFWAQDRLDERSVRVEVDVSGEKAMVQVGDDEAQFDLYPSGAPLTNRKQQRDA